MNEQRMLQQRDIGFTVAEIAAAARVPERRVQTVMRKHGRCRDQRPTILYRVTVMVPEFVTVSAMSKHQASEAVRALYNDNVRIQRVEIQS